MYVCMYVLRKYDYLTTNAHNVRMYLLLVCVSVYNNNYHINLNF